MPRPTSTNVLAVFRSASPEEVAEGREWYLKARALAEDLHPFGVERAAAVIAILSPRRTWDQNVKLARRAYELFLVDGHVDALPTTGDQQRKVTRLLVDGENPDDVVSGPKVRAFWHTIAHPDDPRAVVIDRHAVDVAVGKVTDDAFRGKLLGRKGGYDMVARCYTRAAQILNREGMTPPITPAELQAVTWVTWRNHKGA